MSDLTCKERLALAEGTQPGDVWKHRKHGRTATVLDNPHGLRIRLRHQSGRITVKWAGRLASEFDLVTDTPTPPTTE